MKLSLIIPVYNAAATLGDQLDAIAAEPCAGEWELILADNGSTDASMAIAKSYAERISNVQIVDASDHQGAGYARNKGAQAAVGQTLAFIDADDVIAPGWIAAMIKACETNNFLASRFDYQKLCNQAEQNYCGGTQVNGIQHMWWPPFYPHSGSCGLVVKKTLHDAVGGFDNDWVELQDTDYCIRLYRYGARLRFVPDALMHIRNRSTYKGIFRQAKLWGQYNVLLYKRYRLEDNKLPHPTRRFCRDAFKALKRYIRGPINSSVIYQLGWHVGLLKGSLMYRVAPPVVGLVAIPKDLDPQSEDVATSSA